VVRLAAPRLVDGAESLHKIEVLARLQPAHNEDLKAEGVRGRGGNASGAFPAVSALMSSFWQPTTAMTVSVSKNCCTMTKTEPAPRSCDVETLCRIK